MTKKITEKVTKKEMFNIFIEMIAKSDYTDEEKKILTAKANKEIETLAKKATYKSKKVSAENTALDERIMEIFTNMPSKMMSATEVTKMLEYEFTVPKVTSRLTNLKEREMIERVVDKKKSFYQLAK